MSAEGGAAPIVAGGLEINAATRRVIVRNQEIRLTQKEFDLLHHLASHPNVAIPHGNLLQAVQVTTAAKWSTLRVFVNQLRKKIELDRTRVLVDRAVDRLPVQRPIMEIRVPATTEQQSRS